MDLELPELDAHSARILKSLSGRVVTVTDKDQKVVGATHCQTTEAGGRETDDSQNLPAPQGFSFLVAVAFSVNYIMGTGFLTLPWAFSQTGYLSFLIVIIITIAAIIGVNMSLESMARADLYLTKQGSTVNGEGYEELDVTTASNPMNIDRPDKWIYSDNVVEPTIGSFEDLNNSDDGSVDDSNSGLYYKKSPVASTAGASEESSTKASKDGYLVVDRLESGGNIGVERAGVIGHDDTDVASSEPLAVKERRVEIVEQCKIFLGPVLQLAYILFLSSYMFGALWAYGTVFANALASNVPIPHINSYLFYLLLFGFIVVPLSCMELEETITIQVILSVGRVSMVILMVSTIFISSIWGSGDDFGDDMIGGDVIGPLRLGGLHHLLPVAAFAHIFHHAIPALSEPVIDKSQLSNIYTGTLVFCFLAYTAIALSVSLFFGSRTMTSSNLNWINYGHHSSGFSHFIKRIVGTFIVMFPALDVASAFPLNAVTLGNNLFSVVYGKKVHTMGNTKRHKIVFRLFGAIPPLIMAAVVSDLGQITDYTGVTGFGIAFVFPPLLSYYSYRKMYEKGLPTTTLYSNFATAPSFCMMLFIFGMFLCIYVPIALSRG